MNKELIGLNRYLKEFKTNEDLNKFMSRNKHKYAMTYIFMNNGFCLELKTLRQF